MNETYVWIASAERHRERWPAAAHTWEGSGSYNRRTGYPMALPQRSEVVAPMVMRDTPEYASPIDGRPITSRSWRREDLKRNDCIEIDPPRKPLRSRVKKRTAPTVSKDDIGSAMQEARGKPVVWTKQGTSHA